MPELKVVSAGAGSGKTWNLCETTANKVAGGLDPARILATTFTRRAAAEMKGRIQAKLLTDPRLGEGEHLRLAERLELAAIGTVHSVGHQLISRYAIALGLSPDLQVLEEEGSARCLRGVLASTDPGPWQRLAKLGAAFELGNPQDLALQLLDAKRSNRIDNDAFRQQMQESSERVRQLLAPKGPTKKGVSFEALFGLAEKALQDLEDIDDTTKTTEEAKQKLRRMAAAKSEAWRVFVQASRMSAGKRSGADDCLSDLRAAGAKVRRNPALHQQIRQLMELLTEQTLNLDRAYAAYKAERGQVDFTDLETQFLLLLSDDRHTGNLRRDFDLALVDEFQDTNPLQLAIFQRLRGLAAESHWIGDPKQSIYGFRGTDPQLVREVWDQVPEAARDHLPRNWRSQRGLVQLVGHLFRPKFGKDVEQIAERPDAPRGIERWLMQSRNEEQDAICTALGVAQLHQEGTPLRNLAIFGRRNRDLAALGDALDALGIPSLLELPGLLSTREGALALAGLRLVADRNDSLAAATIMHLLCDPKGKTPKWLADRIRQVRDQRRRGATGYEAPWSGDPLIERIAGIDSRCIPPCAVVELVMEAADLGGRLCSWGQSARRAAHLDALVHLARQYEEEAADAGAAATLSGLIAYLEALASENEDTRLPPYGLDAVTLLTYHKAKGLEWPVVILTSLNYSRSPDLWSPVVLGGQPQSDDPLQDRTMRYWLWPFGRDDFGRVTAGSGLDTDALDAPEGREAQEREESEALRLLYVGFTRARDKLVLAHREGKCSWLNMLPDIDSVLAPALDPGEHALKDIDTTYVVRHLDSQSTEHQAPRSGRERWLKSPERAEAAPRGERFHSPSGVPEGPAERDVTIEELPGAEFIAPQFSEQQAESLGNSVHAYFAALRSTRSLDKEGKRAVALRCLQGFGVEKAMKAESLVAVGERFQDWVETGFPEAAWHTEVPVTAPREPGGQWNGFIDFVLVLPSGEVSVIDHKSMPIPRGECAEKAQAYAGQLGAYREALEAQGLKVRDTWIHFPLSGVMANV